MLYLTDIVLIACLVSWLVFEKVQVKSLGLVIIGLILLIWLGMFHVEHISIGVYQAAKWSMLLALIWYLADQAKSFTWNPILLTLAFSAILQSMLGIYQFHVQHSTGLGIFGEYIAPLGTPGLATMESESGKVIRSYGTFPHPNVLGGFLVLGLTSLLVYVSRETLSTVRSKLLVSCGTFIIGLGLFYTFSRTAWLGAGLVFLSALIYQFSRKNLRKIANLGLPIFILALFVIIFHSGMLFHRSQVTEFNSITDRKVLNDYGLRLFTASPILGTGLGNYIPNMQKMFHEDISVKHWMYQPAHNIFIVVAAQIGLLGLSLFVYLLYMIFRFTWNQRSRPVSYMLFCGGVAVLVMSMFDHYFVTIQQGQLTFFTLLGLMAASGEIGD